MTFIENIYKQVSDLTYLTTDEFSINWLQQSRSYYSSNKARGIEASTSVLVKLMNKLTEQKTNLQFVNQNNHPFLVENTKKYDELAKLVGKEIAHRSIKSNLANKRVKDMLVNIVNEVNEKNNMQPLPIIIGF